jgi:hypothetical protein
VARGGMAPESKSERRKRWGRRDAVVVEDMAED